MTEISHSSLPLSVPGHNGPVVTWPTAVCCVRF